MYTLTLVFNKDRNKILLCHHRKKDILNFVGGKVNVEEWAIDASYRELFEETGITRNDIDLQMVKYESATAYTDECWNMYVTAGILNKDVELKEEKNELLWLPIENWRDLLSTGFWGDNVHYLLMAVSMLGIKLPEV